MIGLVLNDTGREILELQLEPLAVAIERRHRDVLGARHPAAHFGNAEAAFPAFYGLVANHDDLGVDERDGFALAPAVGIEHRDEHPQAFVHLRRGQPDT